MPFRIAILTLLLVPAVALGRTWSVLPDGSGDAMTIQAGIDSAVAGDTVLIACGTYFEHDLVMKSDIVLTSETGTADCVTVDAGQLGRGIFCDAVTGSEITGITFTNGRVSGGCFGDPGTGAYCMGGGMLCMGSSMAVTRCAFVANSAEDNGGGATCLFSSPTFTECTFAGNDAWVGGGLLSAFPPGAPVLDRCRLEDNRAGADGGAVYVFDTALTLTECTLSGNEALRDAGGIFWLSADVLTVDHTIVAGSLAGEAIGCGYNAAVPVITCSDLWGNAGGDWTGCIAPMAGSAGNLSSDPLFCPAAGDASVAASSPCAPGATSCGAIGAGGVGCGALSAGEGTVPASWGKVKAGYR